MAKKSCRSCLWYSLDRGDTFLKNTPVGVSDSASLCRIEPSNPLFSFGQRAGTFGVAATAEEKFRNLLEFSVQAEFTKKHPVRSHIVSNQRRLPENVSPDHTENQETVMSNNAEVPEPFVGLFGVQAHRIIVIFDMVSLIVDEPGPRMAQNEFRVFVEKSHTTFKILWC